MSSRAMYEGQIGYLVRARHVLCEGCAEGAGVRTPEQRPADWSPVYRVNVGQYAQDCHDCGAMLVDGASEQWPVLFATYDPGRGPCPTCVARRYRSAAPIPATQGGQ